MSAVDLFHTKCFTGACVVIYIPYGWHISCIFVWNSQYSTDYCQKGPTPFFVPRPSFRVTIVLKRWWILSLRLFAMLWAESSGWWVPHVHLRFLSRYLTLRQTDEVLHDQPLVFIAWRLLSVHKNLNRMWNRNRSETWIKAQVMSQPSERRIKRGLMTGWASGQRMEVWPVF